MSSRPTNNNNNNGKSLLPNNNNLPRSNNPRWSVPNRQAPVVRYPATPPPNGGLRNQPSNSTLPNQKKPVIRRPATPPPSSGLRNQPLSMLESLFSSVGLKNPNQRRVAANVQRVRNAQRANSAGTSSLLKRMNSGNNNKNRV